MQHAAPKQFKFESAWLLENSYKYMISSCWDSIVIFLKNLVIFQREVERWKCNMLDTLLYHRRNIMLQIDGIEKSLAPGSCSNGFVRLEKKLLNELAKNLKKGRVDVVSMFKDEIASWRDRNTQYYHLKVVNGRKGNNVVMLRNNARLWMYDPVILQALINGYYKTLFFIMKHEANGYKETSLILKLVLMQWKNLCCQLVTRKSKHHFLAWSIGRRDPGGFVTIFFLRRFKAGLFQRSWDTVGKNICEFLRDVWREPSSGGARIIVKSGQKKIATHLKEFT